MKAGRRTAVVLVALLLDRYLGEPPEAVHPVVWIGRTVGALAARAPRDRTARLLYGAGLVGGVCGGSALAARLLEGRLVGPSGLLAEGWLLKSCLSYRALERAGERVAERLEGGDLEGSRKELLWLVGRDRSKLDANEVAAAAVESLAENLSDSFAAPLLAYAAFGLPGAFFYRAANTADAMVGYREEPFTHTGRAAARLDDALNLVPARLTALALVLAASRDGACTAGDALRVALRDGRLTESPNAGWPMAAAAGALGVRLEKRGHYRLNAEAPPPAADDLRRAGRLVRRAAAVLVALVLLGVAAGRPR